MIRKDIKSIINQLKDALVDIDRLDDNIYLNNYKKYLISEEEKEKIFNLLDDVREQIFECQEKLTDFFWKDEINKEATESHIVLLFGF